MSRRRSADHARVKRIIDTTKALEERKHKLLPSILPLSELPGPPIPQLQTPTSSAISPSPTPDSGSSVTGNSAGNSSSGQGGGGGTDGGSGNGGGNGSSGGDSGTPSTSGSGASNPGSGGGSSISPTSTPAPGTPAGATDASQSTGDTTSSSLPGVVDAGSGSSTSSFIQHSVPSISPNGVPVVTSTHGQLSVPAVTGNPGGGGNNGADSESNALGQSHGLSSGGIAGIVIALLIVGLATLIVTLRKRAIARRVERRQQWYGRGIASTAIHSDNGSSRIGSIGSRKIGTTAGTRSARSSFATTFDQSQTPRNVNFDPILPPIPPMAEIRGEGPFILGMDLNSPHMTNTSNKRDSAGSKNSTASDPNAQYLFLPPISQDNGAIGTPMSVRPFSPSELYSFPKPPSDADRTSGGRVSVFSQLHDNSGQVDGVRMSDATDHPSVEEVDPFADPIAASAATQPNFADIEVIRRPFMPTLEDELIVVAGDRVRILQPFDDGWILVQKVPPPVDRKGKGREVDEFDQGLIPIDCLRDGDQDLPEFIAQQRVSSYAENSDVNAGRAL